MPSLAKRKRTDKPAKPHADFPLFPHATKRWAKKIRGKMHYFGPWDDPQAALQKYLDQKDDLLAGRTPRVSGEGVTIRDLVNRFLTVKQQRVASGELSQRTFLDYFETCERVINAFGKTRPVIDLASDDFESLRAEIATTRGFIAIGNEVQRTRSLFKYAYDAGLIERPVRFGPAFNKPNRKALRKARHAKGPRMFEAAEIKALLRAASPQMQAMILLGVNCGFGNSDVGTLPITALDLEAGWVNYPRPKTAVARRVPLWPETAKALKAVLASRPQAKDPADAQLVFITKYGGRWLKNTPDNPISKEIAKLLNELGIRRPGVNFYALRHTFETIGGESRDQVAVDSIMGHAPGTDDMASVYRERISDERLVAVTEHVKTWLFAKPKKRRKAS